MLTSSFQALTHATGTQHLGHRELQDTCYRCRTPGASGNYRKQALSAQSISLTSSLWDNIHVNYIHINKALQGHRHIHSCTVMARESLRCLLSHPSQENPANSYIRRTVQILKLFRIDANILNRCSTQKNIDIQRDVAQGSLFANPA